MAGRYVTTRRSALRGVKVVPVTLPPGMSPP